MVLIECGSVMVIRGVLIDSDFLTLLSPDQVALEMASGVLTLIDAPVPHGIRRIGVTTRSGWRPTASQAAMLDEIERAATQQEFRKTNRPRAFRIGAVVVCRPIARTMQGATYIGFGEAGKALASPGARAFDVRNMAYDYAAAGVRGVASAREAFGGAHIVLSLVTADQALAAAREYAPLLSAGALWLDMNSVAPSTKRAAASAIETAGGRYVDVAVMSPVHPAGHAVPLLVAGPHAAPAVEALTALGFTNMRIVAGEIGAASSIKMIRSVMVKGLEALSAECALAAYAAGVEDDVIASLDASWKEQGWAYRFDYNLDRMLFHGRRRAAEMTEVVKTLDDLGMDAPMTRAALDRQRALGSLAIGSPQGLEAKISLILDRKAQAA